MQTVIGNQVSLTISLLLDVRNVLLLERKVHRDSSRLNGDTSFLLVITIRDSQGN